MNAVAKPNQISQNEIFDLLVENFEQQGPSQDLFHKLSKFSSEHPEFLKSIKDRNPMFLKDCNSIMGHMRMKPYGYAGDFEVIDKIYRKEVSPEYSGWDLFAINNAGSVAVRNRKKYFKNNLSNLINEAKKPLTLLNLASGPARDVLELYQKLPNPKMLETTCIELDTKAIAFAEDLVSSYKPQINFINKNVVRFQPTEKYDVIWSAGLFDYFDDKVFVHLLKKMKTWLKPNGTIIIGNFNEDHNPSRACMEHLCEWYLIHRTEDHLINIAKEAGFEDATISVEHEEQNVNLFLKIRV